MRVLQYSSFGALFVLTFGVLYKHVFFQISYL